ncbi:Multidrug resistance-like ATP-binding protein MdlB [bioreactor metagenome]
MTDSITVLVAQRVSTVMDADTILVLDEGKLVGKGTHKELLETNETYAEIVRSQLREEDLA